MRVNPISKLNIEDELLLRIGGENDPHSIPWDILRNVGDKLEELILSIAKYSTEEAAVAVNNFKLEFSGFYDGSAVPGFRLTSSPIPTFFDDRAARKDVQHQFSSIIAAVDKGNYQSIIDKYNSTFAKNDIIKKVYDFANSAGNKKVAFVRRTADKKFKEVYKVRKIKKEVLDKLIISEPDVPLNEKSIETTGVARVITKKTSTGQIRTKAQEIYNDKEAILSLKFSEIPFGKRKYILKSPILFQIESEGKFKIIENESLDIYASGNSINEAKEELYFQFDNTYQRLISLDDDKLGKKLLDVKSQYKFIIKTIWDI